MQTILFDFLGGRPREPRLEGEPEPPGASARGTAPYNCTEKYRCPPDTQMLCHRKSPRPPSVLEFTVTTKRGNGVKVKVEFNWRKGYFYFDFWGPTIGPEKHGERTTRAVPLNKVQALAAAIADELEDEFFKACGRW